MQSRTSRRYGEDRLLVVALWWLVAGFSFYVLYLPGDEPSFLQGLLQRVIPLSFQPLAGPFLTLALTVALLLASIWALRCSRDGAFLVCAAWTVAAVARVMATESGLWGRLEPVLPGLAAMLASLHETLAGLAGGAFSSNDFAIAAVGSALAYLVVLNSIPPGA